MGRVRSVIPEAERGDLIEAFAKRLTGGPGRAAARGQGVEQMGSRHRDPAPDPEVVEEFTGPDKAIAIARIENHYMANHGWLEEGQLLQGAGKLQAASPASSSRGGTIAAPPPSPPGS